MSQYNTRINITVKYHEDWEEIKGFDFNQYGFAFGDSELEEQNKLVVDGDWSLDTQELKSLVEELAHKLPKSTVIIADTTDFNVDPFLYCVYAVNGEVYSKWTSYEDCYFVEQYDLNIANIKKYVQKMRLLNTIELPDYIAENNKKKGNKVLSDCCEVNGALYSKDMSILYSVPDNYRETVFEVPAETHTIRSKAFSNTRLLEKVIFQGAVHIEEHGFYCLEKLTSVNFSDEQTVVPKAAFFKCRMLKNLVLPKELKRIEERAFEKCGIETLEIPETVEFIGDSAFEYNLIQKVEIPKSVTNIGKNIFGGSLKEIYIYDNIDSCGSGTYVDLVNGKKEYLESAIGLIGSPYIEYKSKWSMYETYFSPYTIIVKSVETDEIINRVFMPGNATPNLFFSKHWKRNAEFDFLPLDEAFPNLDTHQRFDYAVCRMENPNSPDESAMEKFKRFISRNGKREIAGYITHCYPIEEFIRLEKFGVLKKSNIDELIDLVKFYGNRDEYAEYLEKYKKEHFASPRKKKTIVSEPQKDAIPLPTQEAVKSVNETVGKEPSCKSIKEIDKTSDEYMKKNWLVHERGEGEGWITRYRGDDEEVVFPETVCGIKIKGIDFRSGAMPKHYPNIKSIVIPEGYECIGESAFSGCTSLEKIILPTTLQMIESKAFMNCSSLKSIVIPYSVGSFDDSCNKWVFRDCIQLEDVYIINKYWTPGNSNAFKGCQNITFHAVEGASIQKMVKPSQFVVIPDEEAEKMKKNIEVGDMVYVKQAKEILYQVVEIEPENGKLYYRLKRDLDNYNEERVLSRFVHKA